MLEKVKKIYGNMLIFGGFSLLLGFVLLMYPSVSEKVICYGVAVLAAVYGLVHVTLHFMLREAFTFPLDLLLGIGGLVIGVVLVVYPIIIIAILPIVLGVILAIDGFMKIINAFDLKKATYKYWWIALIMGLVSIGLAICMIGYLIDMPILELCGFALVLNGLFDVFNMIVIAKYKK